MISPAEHSKWLNAPLAKIPGATPPPSTKGGWGRGSPLYLGLGGGLGRRGKGRGGGADSQGQTMPSLPPPPCSSHIWLEKSCFPMLAHSWLGIQEYSCYPFSLYPPWLSSSLRRVAKALPPSWPGYVVPLIAGNGPNTSVGS